MNENIVKPSNTPEVPWPTSDSEVSSPDRPTWSETGSATTAPVDPLQRVAQGAHDAVDRFADRAAPKVRHLGENVAGARTALRAGADKLVGKRDEWAESLRGKVRSSPLIAVAAAVALGALFARVTR